MKDPRRNTRPDPAPHVGRHPFEAFLRVLAAWAIYSFAFNLAMQVLDFVGLAGWLTSFMFGSIALLLVTLVLFAGPVARAAAGSRRMPWLVLLAGALAIFGLFVAALRYELRPILNWLYPHWPGVDLTWSRGELEFVAICAVVLLGASSLILAGSGDEAGDPAQPSEGSAASTTVDGLQAAGEQAEAEVPDVEPDFC